MASFTLRMITETMLVALVMLLIFQQIACQGESTNCRSAQSAGREFIVGFLQTSLLESTKEVHISGTSRSYSRVTITAPDIFNEPRETEITGSRQFKIIDLSDIPDATNTAILIQSTASISVVGIVAGNNTGAFLALPTEALGNEYFVVTYEVSPRLHKSKRGSEFIVIGTADNTRVFIRFTGSVRYDGTPYNAGDSHTITVNRLEIVRFVSKINDLTGTHVIADQPVVVTSGSKCADVPSDARYCDHIIEQMPPFQFWGSHFVTTPLAGRTGGDIFRVIAGRNGTSVTVCDTWRRTLNAGEKFEKSLPSNLSCAINSSKPVLVVQYSKGASSDGTSADPSMMLVPALEHYITESLFTMPDISLKMTTVTSFLNVALQCELIPFVTQNMFELSSTFFQGSRAFNVSVAGRSMCSAQIPLDGRGHYLFQFENVPGSMSLVLYGNAVRDIATSFGLPVGLSFKDNSCFTLGRNFLEVPAALTDPPGTPRPTFPPGWHTADEPANPENVGTRRDENQQSDQNNLLAISLIIVMVAMIFVTILLGYVVILRKRVDVLEKEKKNYSNVQTPHGPDGYIGLDGSQIAHREYMTLNNSDEMWHLNSRRSDRSSLFRGIQPAHSMRSSASSVALPPGSRPQSEQSMPTSRVSERDTAELLAQYSAPNRDPPTPSRDSGQSGCFGNVNPSFSEVDTLPGAQDTISEMSFQPSSLRTPNRPVRRHHSQVERFNTTTPIPKPRFHGPRALRRCASTPGETLTENAMKVHYHVPRGDPVFAYDRPRNRTCSEGPSPSAADILRPLGEASNRCSRESSSNESETSLPLPQDDGYMSMKEARISTTSKSSQSTVGSSPIKEIVDETYSEESGKQRGHIDEDSTEYTELY